MINSKTHIMSTEIKLSPPWEVVELVIHRLDPPSLASAACVCKLWSAPMTADHIWKPICSAAYPALSRLHDDSNPAVTYRKLFSLGRVADLRLHKTPREPHVSMRDLSFALDIVQNGDESRVVTIVAPGARLKPADRDGTFRFEIEVGETVAVEAIDELRITWNVLMGEFRSVFTMMECRGKGNFIVGLDGWFCRELPAAAAVCCSSSDPSEMVADLRLWMRKKEVVGGRMVLEKISVGVLSEVSWRYMDVDDVLRYLQYFLLP